MNGTVKYFVLIESCDPIFPVLASLFLGDDHSLPCFEYEIGTPTSEFNSKQYLREISKYRQVVGVVGETNNIPINLMIMRQLAAFRRFVVSNEPSFILK